MTNIRKSIGGRIRQIRAVQKLTQAEMAKRLDVSPATVSGWEIGDYGISLESAARITELATVSLDWLITGKQSTATCEPNNSTTPEEARLLEAFRQLSKTSQAAVLRVAEMMQK
jgi:transcriptional regulator with XRE-family HTH domain